MAPVRLSENEMLDIMRDALRQNRVDLYLQPIVIRYSANIVISNASALSGMPKAQ